MNKITEIDIENRKCVCSIHGKTILFYNSKYYPDPICRLCLAISMIPPKKPIGDWPNMENKY